jgi:hypothetical protein
VTTAREDEDMIDAEVVDEAEETLPDEAPRWWQRLSWPRRTEVADEDTDEDDTEPGAEVVQLHKTPSPVAPVPVEVDRAPSKARTAVARITDRPLPSRRQVVASTSWWARTLAKLIPLAPVLLARELRPILRGIGKVASGWSRWAACAELAEAAKKAEGNERSKAGERLENRKAARTKVSIALGLLVLGVGVWALLARPWWLLGIGILAIAVFDLIGRAGQDPTEKPILLPTGPIVEGVPLSSLRAEIAKSLLEEGIEATVAMPHPVEHGWTVAYHARQAVEDEHLRQVERDLNIRCNGITQIVEKDQAARGTLHIMLRDPLANTVDSPEHGVLSIHQPLPLGVTASGTEWNEHFLRTHFTVIGASQSGKSSCLWQATDVLRRCPEVELDAIDLTEGPAFGAPWRAFRRRAFDEASALQVLTEAKELCQIRNAELKRRAEHDDTPDEYEEKHHPSADEPQRVVLIDEFARIAENKDLLPLVEYLLRYGAKAAVTVGIAGQGATLADFGTSVVRGQVMLKIMFACGRDDVLWLFGKDARNGGYRPDLFEPANGDSLNDAGKCFVMSSMSRTPEPRRAYRLEQSEVRRRDRALGSRTPAEPTTVDAVEVPPVLAAVEQAFRAAGDPDRMATADLLGWLREAGMELDERALADQLRPHGLRPREERWRPAPKANPVRGYYLADARQALRELS